MTSRVSLTDLEYEADYHHCRYNGVRYTGLVDQFGLKGEKLSETEYVDGVPKGLELEWFSTGEPKAARQLDNYVLHGESFEWDESGQLRCYERGIDGIALERMSWDASRIRTLHYVCPTDDPLRVLAEQQIASGSTPLPPPILNDPRVQALIQKAGLEDMATALQDNLSVSPDERIRNAIYDMNLTEVISALEEGANPDGVGGGCCLLIELATCKNSDFVEQAGRLLIEKGADVNRANEACGDTPLLSASFFGHAALVRLLVEQGADLNWRESIDPEARTAIMEAASQGHTQIMEYLISKGADPSFQNGFGESAESLLSDYYKRKADQTSN